MSKAVVLDHEFDKEKYISLLRLAKGGRSQTEFAKAAKVSTAYMCKSLRGYFTNAPTPSTIKKIAACSHGGITYADLLDAAGYDVEKYCPKEEIDSTFANKKLEIIVNGIIATHLLHQNISFYYSPENKLQISSFCLELSNYDYRYWDFLCVPFENIPKTLKEQDNRLLMYFGRLLMTDLINKPRKFSFVTGSQEVYDTLMSHTLNYFGIEISVILIDENTMSFKNEYTICTDKQPLK